MQDKKDVSNITSPQGCENCAINVSCFIEAFDIKKYQPFKKTHTLQRGEVLLQLDQPLKKLYVVKSGILKNSLPRIGGDEYIANFALAGEIVGLKSLHARKSIVTTVALTFTELCSFQLDGFWTDLANDAKLAVILVELMARKISMDAISYFNRSGSALERVEYFLRNMAERIHQSGNKSKVFTLSMSRQEIANYLNLKTETVSRALSKLQAQERYLIKHREVHLICD